MAFYRDCYIFNSKMLQGKVCAFIMLCGFLAFLLLFNHFETKISELEEARRKLASSVSLMQGNNIGHPQDSPLTSLLDQSSELEADSFFYDSVIIYNRVPKTGSTSFMGVVYDLCTKNGYNVLHINTTRNSHILSLSDQVRFMQNVTTWNSKKPALYHGHIAFVDFSRFSVTKKPIYINVIRKPLERLVSYYYFLRYGDDFRPNVVRRRQGNKMSFDECVEKQEKDCDPENLWLQIPFFCGHFAECWVPGSEWALAQAKHNLVHQYLLVGVTEELQDFIALLEAVLPRFFRGATNYYVEGSKSHLRKTYFKDEPSPETVAKFQKSKIWHMESKFYDFALQHFHFMRKRTLTITDGVVADKGQQFMYEKIRPK